MYNILISLIFIIPCITLSAETKYKNFPKSTYFISQFHKIAKDKKLIEKQKEEITKKTKTDPDIKNHQKLDSKSKKDGYGDFYDSKLPSCQQMVLIPAPGKSRAAAYFNMAIKKKAPLLITLCSAFELTSRVAFWEPKIAEKLKLKDGWKLTCESENVLYKGKKGEMQPKIVERVYNATKGSKSHKMTHLHYENWPDKKEANDLKALNKLFERRDQLVNDNNQPIIINCKGGRGRTGEVAVIDCARKLIDKELKAGKSLDEIKLNIPEIILGIKKTRPKTGGNVKQIAQVYEVIGNHYETLKTKS